jgi:hypothetical protein
MSRGRVLGAVGNVAASLAQSKRVGRGEMACLWSCWVKLGCVGGDGGVDSGRGGLMGVDGLVGDVEAV